jgi:2'-5' RNA ligase
MTEHKTSIDLHFEDLDLLIGRWRLTTVASATRNDPPHITLLSPWRTPLQDRDLEELRAVLHVGQPFQICFVKLGRFGDHTLYLEPEENEHLSRIMQNLVITFPDTPPYGGAFSKSIPHVTVAQASDAETLNRFEQEITAHLVSAWPITAQVTEVLVKQREINGSWEVMVVLPLGSS